MAVSLRERIESDTLFVDSAIIGHGHAPYLRDYDVVIDVPAALPPGIPLGDSAGSYVMGRYRYRFTHCAESHVTTCVWDEGWRVSWDDVFIDHEAWEKAGNPEGFVWGVNWAEAYPGLKYIADSELASSWSERFGREMHEITVTTNAFVLRLVCDDVQVQQIAVGDPATQLLTPIEGDGR